MKINIEKIVDVNGWKPMSFTTTDAFVSDERCICCNGKLKTIALITTAKEDRAIRVGCCPTCGFVSYIDKPSHQWIINFYTSTWNTGESENDFVKTDITSTTFTDILTKLQVSKSALICEIGTGRGGNFAALKNNGYTNLVGVENSSHRAQMVTEKINVPVYSGGFEEEVVQKSLKKHGIYDVIYSAHVFEHVYNPEESIELCSKLQKEGGRLVIAVPNFVGEPTMGILGFLPHLHSFTENSLTELLRRKGYIVTDTSYIRDSEVLLIAEKKENVGSSYLVEKDFPTEATLKFEAELMISQIPSNSSVLYLFSRKNCHDTQFFLLRKTKIVRFFQKKYRAM